MLLLRPHGGVIEPVAVEKSAYFSEAQISRAQDFRQPQLWLYGLTLAIELGVLAWLTARPPMILQRVFRRPVLAAGAAGAALAVGLALAQLPVAAIMRERARDVGLVTQSWDGYAADLAKSWAITAVLAGVGAMLAVVLMRRMPRTWWLPGAAIVFAFGAGTIYAGPVLIDPLFNRFEPARPAVKADVEALARAAGVDVGEVLEVDGSRRSTAANAYVTGVGHTKRVVLYDTLVDNFDRDEVKLVVAHELAHVKHHDIRNGFLYLLIVAPAGMWAIAQVTRRLDPDSAHPGAQTLPALALAVTLVVTPIAVVSNQLSRSFEAHADSEALRLTGDPDAAIGFQREIALRNVSDPDPPAWAGFLFATHPSTVDRIGIAERFRRER